MSQGGINSAVQRIKYSTRGYRSQDTFRAAIYFLLGGLDFYPRPAGPLLAHTTS